MSEHRIAAAECNGIFKAVFWVHTYQGEVTAVAAARAAEGAAEGSGGFKGLAVHRYRIALAKGKSVSEGILWPHRDAGGVNTVAAPVSVQIGLETAAAFKGSAVFYERIAAAEAEGISEAVIGLQIKCFNVLALAAGIRFAREGKAQLHTVGTAAAQHKSIADGCGCAAAVQKPAEVETVSWPYAQRGNILPEFEGIAFAQSAADGVGSRVQHGAVDYRKGIGMPYRRESGVLLSPYSEHVPSEAQGGFGLFAVNQVYGIAGRTEAHLSGVVDILQA